MVKSIIFNDSDVNYYQNYPTTVDPDAFMEKVIRLIGVRERYEDGHVIELKDAERILLWIRDWEVTPCEITK